MNLFIVSDLHISGPKDPLYSSLLSLLQHRAGSGDKVILAGDLFDLFVGNKAVFTERYADFLMAIDAAGHRGVEIHYIEGNHDFLIHRAFQRLKGITIHSLDVSFEIEGKRFYIAHGDLVDRRDYGYRFLRGFFRSPIMRALVVLVPGRFLDQVGQSSSKRSRKGKPILAASLPTHRMQYLRKIYRSFAAERLCQGYDFVVMGHCHDLDEMHFNVGGRRGQYINVGFPRVHGSFLTWSPGEEKIHREKLPG